MDRPITTHQAAQILRVTPMTIIRWIDSGKLPAWRTVGGHWRIERNDLETFAAARGITLSDPPPSDIHMRAVLVELLASIPDVPDFDAADYHEMGKHRREHWFALGLARGKANIRDAVQLLLQG